MADAPRPEVYTIAAHRGFADALVAGLWPRYREPQLGLARLTLLLPSRRSVRTVTEAFVRLAGAEGSGGLLLPRMVPVGDLDLAESLGPLLDPLGAGADIPPAADSMRRMFRLAALLADVEGKDAKPGAGLLRRAFETGRTMDKLLVEGIEPADLLSERVVGIVGDLASHWRESTSVFQRVQAHWRAELAARGEVDAPTRRNLLFDRAARTWHDDPPQCPIVAAGVTSASPSLARLLRVVSELPRGAVILPDLDLSLDEEVWDLLGLAGIPREPGGPVIGRNDAVTHPQYHLKLLLGRMGIARREVRPWHRSGPSPAPPARSKAISNLFLPSAGSARWVDLPAGSRRLAGIRVMASAHPGAEAQAIAVLVREALEQPGKRVALVTPDRGLASRVSALLRRWDIEADDSAGQPLAQTAAGRLFLLLAELAGQDFAPVPLIAVLTHPLVRHGDQRARWLESARRLDLALRGPRPAAGLAPLRAIADGARLGSWWQEAEALLAPLVPHGDGPAPVADLIFRLAEVAESLCGEALWANADGRALAGLVDELREAAREPDYSVGPRELHPVLRDAMERVAVRPPWGGHPRVAIYGLLEARMSRADLVICGGLVEGVWPAGAGPDPLVPPAVLRSLGVPGADFRIGLAAHDLAAALGAPEVVLSHAQRNDGAPAVPSRFVLRVKALLGEMAPRHEEKEAPSLGVLVDRAEPARPHPRPNPMPSAEQRKVAVSVTGLDRLRGDPYQFYASSILGLRRLDQLDGEPSAAWKGTAAHAILDRWHKAGEPIDGLRAIAGDVLAEMSAHPLVRALWRPRLMAGLDWMAGEVLRLRNEQGRVVIGSEIDGAMLVRGVRVHGRTDRIDQLADGTLAVVDYKTGTPPSWRQVNDGYALQLGLVAMIAEAGGFAGVAGEASRFEYWSLARDAGRKTDVAPFGFVRTPVIEGGKKTGIAPADFLPRTRAYLDDALDRWILGDDPFTARLNPDLAVYTDYDQLMRLDEWLPLLTGDERDEA